MAASVVSQMPAGIFQAGNLNVAHLCQAAVASIILYDHVITFAQEVNYVWSAPFSFGSVSYLLIRYIVDVIAVLNAIASVGGNQSPQFCNYLVAEVWFMLVIFFLIQLMLQARLYVLFTVSKIVPTILMFAYVCEIVAMACLLGYMDAYSKVTNEVRPGLYACATVGNPPFHHYFFWLPGVLFDGTLCVAMLFQAIRCRMSVHHSNWKRLFLADRLAISTISYFLSILFAFGLTTYIGRHIGMTYLEVVNTYPASLQALIACRLIVDLRTFLTKGAEGGGGMGLVGHFDTKFSSIVAPQRSQLDEQC